MTIEEQRFVQKRSELMTRTSECLMTAEKLLGLRHLSTGNHCQSIDGVLGGGPHSEQQYIFNQVYDTPKGVITLEVAVSPRANWASVVTLTTTDGFTQAFEKGEDFIQLRTQLIAQLKRIHGLT